MALLLEKTEEFMLQKMYLKKKCIVFQLKIQKQFFVITLPLYLWNLTEKPDKYDVAVPINYNPHRIKNIVNVYRVKNEIYELELLRKKNSYWNAS